ncbi:hypothetical protein L4D76_24955 [Photobacterium sagamiensis]|uniref:hypothetical protein n=1 Tax=Photobacterium sagamiensis TaxID=2910241 RepID=UPI003D09960F
MAFGLKAAGNDKCLVWSGWVILATALLVIPPLAGAFLTGKPLAPYLNFMPSTLYVQHPPFSWPVFIALTLLIFTCISPFLYRLLRVQSPPVKPVSKQATFPWWGWLGIALLLFSWKLAWASVDESNEWQRYTFTPLWIGYILLMNALSVKRRGRCLMLSQPGKFLLLFAVSALFWWFFEYLNQFVHNWYYVGLGDISPLSRILSASLSFSTVLPAVLSTTYWMATSSRMQHAYTNHWTFKISYPRLLAVLGLIASTLSLFALGGWPDYFYPLIWLSPLIVLLSLQVLAGHQTVFSSMQYGDWRPVCLPILAGLQCGFCWELWNYGSTAHWQYSIPYVDRFYLFEMPLLGYAGYFSFGLECILIASLLGVEVHADLPES